MTENILGIIKRIPILTPEDTVRKAHALMCQNEISILFTIDQASGTIGYVTEKILADFMASTELTCDVPTHKIANLISTENMPAPVDGMLSIKDCAKIFSSSDFDAMPVTNRAGMLVGICRRRDVLSVMAKDLRPPSVGGMATPIGVYLTTGSHIGGAGSFGLYLTGLMLGLMMIGSTYASEGLLDLYDMFFGINTYKIISIPFIGKMSLMQTELYIITAISIVLLLLMLRHSRLAGIHAAEHMTVHAIEQNEDLTPDVLRRMPRVHPRCGTNLMVGASIFIMFAHIGGDIAITIGFLIVILGWRKIGGWLQQNITTAPPSDYQLKMGIEAGCNIVEKYQKDPSCQSYGFDRIWKMGFLQTVMGLLTVMEIASLLETFIK